MMYRPSMRSLGLALTASAFLGERVQAADSSSPNVLMILTDDQGKFEEHGSTFYFGLTWLDKLMNSMDYMPNVQKLIGDNGVTFDKHYCTSAFCCPSRVSLFTGKCVQ